MNSAFRRLAKLLNCSTRFTYPCRISTLLSCRHHPCKWLHVTISGILRIPLVNLTGCEIRFVSWLLRASGRVEAYSTYDIYDRYRRATLPIKLPSVRFNFVVYFCCHPRGELLPKGLILAFPPHSVSLKGCIVWFLSFKPEIIYPAIFYFRSICPRL